MWHFKGNFGYDKRCVAWSFGSYFFQQFCFIIIPNLFLILLLHFFGLHIQLACTGSNMLSCWIALRAFLLFLLIRFKSQETEKLYLYPRKALWIHECYEMISLLDLTIVLESICSHIGQFWYYYLLNRSIVFRRVFSNQMSWR